MTLIALVSSNYREITIPSAMSDAQVHPKYLGKVISVIRSYPIRVGNIKDSSGNEIGWSGPFYKDSKEISWGDINVPPEITTVTGRPRRICTFSMSGYRNMLTTLLPDYIVLNFANYLSKKQLKELLSKCPEITHIGLGPRTGDVKELTYANI
ncbi:MAG: hypothetical protein GY804_08750 [Alphaproteobacteria bacterium]|nr:hypothetical protein [Alphaproteobacteria bacterium]